MHGETVKFTKWHYFQLASVLFMFELQQVISAIVYM